jgi:hypothetical protein
VHPSSLKHPSLILCLTLCALLSTSLKAQTPPPILTPVSDVDKSTQLARLQQSAIEAAKRGAYDEALAYLSEAKLIMPDPMTLLLTVKVKRRAERCLGALEALQELSRTCEGCALQDKVEEERAALSELCVGTLSLSGEPQGAQVIIDGVEVGRTPLSLQRPAGELKVLLKAEDHQSELLSLTVPPKDILKATYLLKPTTLQASLPLRSPLLHPPPQPSRAPVWAMISGGTVSAAGLTWLFVTQSKLSDQQAQTSSTRDLGLFLQARSEHNALLSQERYAYYTLGAGLALTTTGLLWWLLDSPTSPQAHAKQLSGAQGWHPNIMLGAEGFTLEVKGRF